MLDPPTWVQHALTLGRQIEAAASAVVARPTSPTDQHAGPTTAGRRSSPGVVAVGGLVAAEGVVALGAVAAPGVLAPRRIAVAVSSFQPRRISLPGHSEPEPYEPTYTASSLGCDGAV